MKNKRRVPRAIRKEIGLEKYAQKLGNIGIEVTKDEPMAQQLRLKDNVVKVDPTKRIKSSGSDVPSLSAVKEDCEWTVLKPKKKEFLVKGKSISQ
jgi:hypothetical protein